MNITIYTTPSCPACRQLKEWLNKHKLTYKVIDLTKDMSKGQEMIENTGRMTVPAIKIENKGTIWLSGFNQEELLKVIGG